MRKRLLATLLLVLIIVLNSCADTRVSLLPFMPADGDEAVDFEGYVFKILSGDEVFFDPSKIDASGSALTFQQDALLSWNDHIETTYNCSIVSEEYFVKYMASTQFTPMIAAGTADWSLIFVNGVDLLNLHKGGFLTAWNDTPLDLTDHDKYGSENYMSSSTFNGKTYGINTCYWSAYEAFIGYLICNNNLLRDYSNVNVHEMKENGLWTFDNFKKLLEDCTVNVGSSMDILPMTCFSDRILATTSVFANGGQVVDYDEATGKYSYGLMSPKALKGIEYAKSLHQGGLARQASENGQNFWLDQDAVFLLAGYGLEAAMMVIDDLDVISFPYGPDVEYGSVCSAYTSRDLSYLTCPITAEGDLTAKFVDLYFEPLPDLPHEEILQTFKDTQFYNEESINEFFEMEANYQNKYYTHFGDAHETLISTLDSLASSNGSITEYLEQTRRIFEDQINESFNGK